MLSAAPRRVGIVVQPARMYCRRVVRGIAAVGSRAGWDWLLVPSEGAAALTGAPAAALDGVIGHFADAPSTAGLLGSGLPAVDFSPAAAAGSATACVASDDAAVGRVAAAHLLSLGLAHYAFFGWAGRDDSSARRRGFAGTLAAAGFSCDAFDWPAGDAGDGGGEPDGPTADLARWVAALPKPVGVLASNDRRALQLLAVCRRLGVAVPASVAVVGVDNDEVFCDLANPSLSSVALSTREIGCEAAHALDALMAGRPPERRVTLVPPAGVVPRGSTGLTAIVDADVAAAVRYIALHAKDDLQVADVLREAHVSRRSLDQRFLKALGRTAAQEIGRVQVELAKRALAETAEPMERVAAMAGYSNAKQLGLTFRAAAGMTPTAYRRQHRGPAGAFPA